MPAKTGFQITADDIQILHRVYELRVAQIDHLAALTARSRKALARRLLKLTERGFLACIARLPQKHLYAVGRAGVPVLIESGYAYRDLLSKRLRHSELKEMFVRHLLFVVDIHVKLLSLAERSAIKLIDWREGSVLWDEVPVGNPNGKEITIPVRPDALFTLFDTRRPEGKGKLHFFLEADRSTMSHTRMAQKITGYVNYFQKGIYRRKYPGMKTFVVATVTETRARAGSLAADLTSIIQPASRRAYPFIAFEDLFFETLAPGVLDRPAADLRQGSTNV